MKFGNSNYDDVCFFTIKNRCKSNPLCFAQIISKKIYIYSVGCTTLCYTVLHCATLCFTSLVILVGIDFCSKTYLRLALQYPKVTLVPMNF